jgi:NTP pyrophosphatase (non-canonical NTP hydrolase)
MGLTFEEYQRHSAATAKYPKVFVQQEDGSMLEATYIYPAFGLGGESGEALEKVKKLIRDQRGVVDEAARAAIAKELGDVLWYVSAICKEFQLDMGDVAQGNLDKLASRSARGVLGGSGDNR